MINIFKKLAGLKDKKNPLASQTEPQDAEQIIAIGASAEPEQTEWLGDDYDEGQLSIDVYQTPDKLVIKSTIAGVKPENIDISINNDMLTIRGKRLRRAEVEEENYLITECYWGGFSRSVILPVEVETENVEAALDNGVLTVTLPKAKNAKQVSIKVKEK